MPKIIGKAVTVVEFGGLRINELAGNVATNDDTISIAHVTNSEPSAEPWLTLDYDEWICVLKGEMVVFYDDGASQLIVTAGDTLFVAKGERFKPTFPMGGVEYIPVCLPAFRPDRCIREDAPDSEVALKLRALHSAPTREFTNIEKDEKHPELLYHMCPKSVWETAKQSKSAYFPSTFDVDGLITHATAVPSRLIETANHFYTEVPGDWICLQLTRSALKKYGVVVKDEEAKPVGTLAVSEGWTTWVCPHILGGIPTEGVVIAEFPILRDGSKFISIEGV
jgi:uncharacterized protein (DUF952 family)/mannose-6-phosphate isomerase-like protein (cupin superfamily)